MEPKVRDLVYENCILLGALKGVMRCRTLGSESRLYEGLLFRLSCVWHRHRVSGAERRRLCVLEMNKFEKKGRSDAEG